MLFTSLQISPIETGTGAVSDTAKAIHSLHYRGRLWNNSLFISSPIRFKKTLSKIAEELSSSIIFTQSAYSIPLLPQRNGAILTDIKILKSDKLKCLHSLKMSTSFWSDDLNTRIFTELSYTLAPRISAFFRCSLRQCKIRESWKKPQ